MAEDTSHHETDSQRNNILKPLAVFLLLSTFSLNAQTAKRASSRVLAAAPYTQLYVFGDSYSDSGSGYIDTNGPTAVVYLAQHLAIPFTYYGDPASAGKGLNL